MERIIPGALNPRCGRSLQPAACGPSRASTPGHRPAALQRWPRRAGPC